jgi:RNA polymerase sigma factor (sigma-70 family)
MVMGVCERLLGHHDAEDAFQATFLVLAQKARSVGRPELLANWLYGVAYRTALKARSRSAERRRKEGQAMTPATEDPTADVVWADLRPVLDEEVSRLPDRFRVPFVLCYLQGKTNEEAARALGCPKGTVLSRLATARERLRLRLTRRGVTLSAGLLAATLCVERTSAAVPSALMGPTVKAALGVAAGQIAALVSAEVAALMKGTLRAMLLSKLKVVALAALAVAALGGVLLIHRSDGGEPVNKVLPAEAPGKAKPPKDEEAIQGTWRLVRLDQVGHEPTKDEKAAWEAGAFKAVVTADKIVFPGGSEGAYKLDPTTTPKRIDLTRKNDTETVTVPGIYSLDGDELRLCIGRKGDTKPPASFDIKKAAEGEVPTAWTFKRDKPAKEAGRGVAKKDDAAAKELKAMAGEWRVVGLEEGGRKATADDVKGMKWTFEGAEVVPDNPGLEATDRYKVKLDPTKSPKQIDLHVLEGLHKGKTNEGIYKLEDGRLTICLRDEKSPEKGRPKEFTAAKGSNQGIIILEKAKK